MKRQKWVIIRTLAAFALLLSATLAGALPARATSDVWEAHNPTSNTDIDSYLFRVASLADNDVWAVGTTEDYNGNLTLATHYDGSSWTNNSPSVDYNSELFGVAGVNSSNVWAVGYQSDAAAAGTLAYNTQPTSAGNTLIEKWNGSSWSQQSSPSPGSGFNQLRADCFTSTSNGWAVGADYDGSRGAYQTLAEHWNGSSWSTVSTPDPGTQNYLYGVACVSSSNIWAVGNADSSVLIIHSTDSGSSWTSATSPSPGTALNFLEDVACLTSSDCWAVGEYRNTGTTTWHTLAIHWDGSSWTQYTTPNPGGSDYLAGVAYLASDWAWSVGTELASPNQTLIAGWDGSSWSQVTSVNKGTGDNNLHGVAAQLESTCGADSWAVGWYYNTTDHQDEMLAERYTRSDVGPCN